MKITLFLSLPVVSFTLLGMLFSPGLQSPEEITKEIVLSEDQSWQENYDNYNPDPEMLDALKDKLDSRLKIDVYLGLWCPDSLNNVPPFIKIMDLAGRAVPVRYFAVPEKANEDIKFYVEEKGVERVPTFIIYREGKEIGRIVENPKDGMLEDLMDIVMAQ